jgi:hypothetical protein
LGDERYRTFVRQLAKSDRMRYWQEQAWAEFVRAHPEFAADVAELRTALRICELHGDELLPDTVLVTDGCADWARPFVEARNRLFPHAACWPVYTEGAPIEDVGSNVWYCPACRKALAEWEVSRRKRE